MKNTKNLITHLALVLDGSGSMSHIVDKVCKVANDYIENVKQTSKSLNQETRVSVYSFSSQTKCLFFDKDITRAPQIDRSFFQGNRTALLDATLKVISDLENIPNKDISDYSSLVVILTDGENTENSHLALKVQQKISSLPEEYTIGLLVPDFNALSRAKQFGFPAGNIKIWDSTSEKGAEEAFTETTAATRSYYQAKSLGIKGTKTFFQPNVANLTPKKVATNLDELASNQYMILPVHQKKRIDEFVKSWNGGEYRVGSAYFQLSKPEKIQNYKQVIIREKSTGKVYAGANARQMLALPDYEVTVDSASHPRFDIFVQSTSVNRNLVAGTQLIILK